MTTNKEHTSRLFELELEAVTRSVLQMGELSSKQFQLTMKCINHCEASSIAQILELGSQVNDLEIEIDRKCHLILAHRQPEANDLRLILTILKCTTDIERIGDQAELIAHRAKMLLQRNELSLLQPSELTRSASMVGMMIRNALTAFEHSDIDIAMQVIRQDVQVNEEYSHLTRNLIGHMMEKPQNITAALDILFMAKAIERIGDHAKNIAEYVIFMVKGHDIRHTHSEQAPEN